MRPSIWEARYHAAIDILEPTDDEIEAIEERAQEAVRPR